MKIVVASQSAIKLDAVRAAAAALGIEADIVGVKAPSRVAEQPVGVETEIGARNRCRFAMEAMPGADLYIAIENGIFPKRGGDYLDKAFVLAVSASGLESTVYSSAVTFPDASVAEARARGFSTTTVGQVMAEQDLIATHDDPHLSLAGVPRATLLTDAVRDAIAQRLKWTAAVAGNSPLASPQR